MPQFIQEELQARLDRLKNDKTRGGYMRPKDYQKFLPETLGIEKDDDTLRWSALENIGRSSENATLLANIKHQNKLNYLEMLKQKRRAASAKKGFNQAKSSQPNFYGSFGNYQGERNFAKRWGKDNTPEVSDIRKLNPHAPIVTANWRGHSFQVNRQVADIFIAFLDDLHAAGYKPVSIGGHNDRNIAGTNTPSLHSYGFAIDIDPGKNPVQYGTNNHALPPNVGALAAKYGLSWGGNWKSYKDPMHFSVPYGGRE